MLFRSSWDNPKTSENEFDYQGWYGVRELPEIREVDGRLDDGASAYFDAVIRRWMDPNSDGDPSDGIDGWRLDVAEKVGKPYWKHFRGLVKSINPDAYITAELFWEDWQAKELVETGPWLQGDLFDAVMNYHFAEYAVEFFINEDEQIAPSEFDAKLRNYRARHPEEVNYLMMNLMDSHDTDRLGSMIVNPDRFIDHECSVQHHPEYNIRKPTDGEYGIQKLIAAFQMTYLGAPMIYYGDEDGMWGADDPDCRKPMVWADMNYAVEDSHPLKGDGVRPADSVMVNTDLLVTYKELISIREQFKALRRGDFQSVLVDDDRLLYGFDRTYHDETIRVVFNNSNKSRKVAEDWEWKNWKLLYGNPANDKNLIIPAKSVVIWRVA